MLKKILVLSGGISKEREISLITGRQVYNALKKMGASIKIKDGYIIASAKKGLSGCLIKFPKISVGATQNILIASCFAKGITKLRNCATEPEVSDLINFLKKCKIQNFNSLQVI